MNDESEDETQPEKKEEKPLRISKREFKEAEYHKPPDRDDEPPPPLPPAKETSDKD